MSPRLGPEPREKKPKSVARRRLSSCADASEGKDRLAAIPWAYEQAPKSLAGDAMVRIPTSAFWVAVRGQPIPRISWPSNILALTGS